MATQIHLKPEEVWDYFTKEKSRLSEAQVEIAFNEDTDVRICITNENGFPLFNVYRGVFKIYKEPAVKEDCFGTLRDIYIKYLFPIVTSCDKSKEAPKKPELPSHEEFNCVTDNGVFKRAAGSEGPQDLEDEIYMRDDELSCAVYDALSTFLTATPESMFGDAMEGVIQDIVDVCCERLATDYGISVYRPAWLPCEDDEQTLEYNEYPYDKLAEIENADSSV